MTEIERMLPLYEGKMVDSYDHRDADIVRGKSEGSRKFQPRYLSLAEHEDVYREPVPAFWVREAVLPGGLSDALTCFLNITSATNERTVRSALIPRSGVGDMLPVWTAAHAMALLAVLNSIPFDFLARQKVAGLHLTYTHLRQIPLPTPDSLRASVPWEPNERLIAWLEVRSQYLSHTSNSLPRSDGRSITRWDERKRETVRTELDAAMFHLYGLKRDDVEYVMETFPIVKRKDTAVHGEYRTKRLILETYDAMAEAVKTGVPYESPFDDVLSEDC